MRPLCYLAVVKKNCVGVVLPGNEQLGNAACAFEKEAARGSCDLITEFNQIGGHRPFFLHTYDVPHGMGISTS